MKQETRISKFGLSVLVLGLSAFPISTFANPPSDTDEPDTVHAVALKETPVAMSQDVESQVNNLRNLFEAAGRNGLVDLKNRELSEAEITAGGKNPQSTGAASDCMTLAPLFDGGQGSFATGLFTELRVDWPENAVLAGALADLIDPSYDGRPLPVDLSRAGECGPSFLPWQALADPAHVLDAKDETVLTAALAGMDTHLRRQLGVQIAIRAGLAGNLRLTRRVSDTLIDAKLHGQPHHDRDPEHILLDGILKMSRDPVGARTRLSWIAERDGPEQMIALDLMRKINAAPAARSELKRLSESPDPQVRDNAKKRLLTSAIEDDDIVYVAELVTSANNLVNNEGARARLAVRLEEAIEADDPLKAIQALDVIGRLEGKGIEFSPALKAKAEARLQALTSGSLSVDAADFKSSLQKTAAPDHLSGPELTDYLDTVNVDMDTYREVLSRG
ncbi:hypothetical protein GCM10009069_10650 [Algimonas arctica]|uniref:HEAT repeat domain-containing protein n=1 Tax=Algimonas arctica TaxID=1479486 RepID=A0A8J3CPW2_9PROT|nr:hypothetical protein [Algimonas arctica]GHA89428.1 hypothetical protein GCM10009069_10650 [Algimonas arctica]